MSNVTMKLTLISQIVYYCCCYSFSQFSQTFNTFYFHSSILYLVYFYDKFILYQQKITSRLLEDVLCTSTAICNEQNINSHCKCLYHYKCL